MAGKSVGFESSTAQNSSVRSLPRCGATRDSAGPLAVGEFECGRLECDVGPSHQLAQARRLVAHDLSGEEGVLIKRQLRPVCGLRGDDARSTQCSIPPDDLI